MFQILDETFPIEPLTLTATVQPFSCHSHSLKIKPIERSHIAADTVILIVSSEFSCQGRPPFLGLLVIPYLPKPVVHVRTFLTKLLPARLTAHNEFTPATCAAEMGKPQKVKGIGLTSLSLGVLSFISAEIDGSRLLRV